MKIVILFLRDLKLRVKLKIRTFFVKNRKSRTLNVEMFFFKKDLKWRGKGLKIKKSKMEI